jgi:membrane protein required for colicin V production
MGFDVAAAAVLVVAVLLGLTAGLVRIALGLVSLALGAVAGLALAEPAGRLAARWVRSPELELVVGFVSVFALVLLGFSFLAWLVRRTIRRLGLGWVDRGLGALAGGAAAFAAAAIVAFALLRLAPGSTPVAGSRAVPWLAGLAARAVEELPPAWRAEGRRLGALARGRLDRRGRPQAPAPPAAPPR